MKPAISRNTSLSPHFQLIAHDTRTIIYQKPSWVSPSWQSAFWKVFSCVCFAGINGVVRYLTGGSPLPLENPLPVSVITFFQNVVGTVCMLPWLFKYGLGSLRTKHPRLHITRVSTAVLGVLLWYLALAHMPITQAVGLMFTGPVFSAIAARIFLKETVDKRRAIAILLSFVGAFIILRPDQPLLDMKEDFKLWVAWLPLSAAIAIAISKINTRQLGKLGEPAHMMTTYLLLFMAPISLIPALLNWQTPSLH
ncbi:MAG: DMT family transporter, partial [Alphaproteobacteria bacterium]|nr:DMT family transporter [Alphaproteobacteria bacterium]